MDAGLLDVLHDRRDVGVDAVAERVDVDLDRVLDEAIDGLSRRRRRRRRRGLRAGVGGFAADAQHTSRHLANLVGV